VKAMRPYHSEIFGNPGSLHKFGQEASAAVFKARNKISKLINCDYREIIFTGSATEANNLAIRGVIKAASLFSDGTGVVRLQRADAPAASRSDGRTEPVGAPKSAAQKQRSLPGIITSKIEHGSVLETCRDLEKEGLAEVIYLPVSKSGIVDLKKLKASLNERTVLVSIMYANNEMGAIQPLFEVSKIIKEFKIIRHCEESATLLRRRLRTGETWPRLAGLQLPHNDRFINNSLFPLFHTDASQAFNYLDCNVKDSGVDLMTLSSQKIYGPKGVGLLYVKRGMWNEPIYVLRGRKSGFSMSHSPYPISPIITGGGQEEGLRSGTENVAGIVGFAEAAGLVSNSRELETKRLRRLQEYFIKKLSKIYPKVSLNGPAIGEERLPNNINLYFAPNPAAGRASAQKDLIFKLDMAGFAVSGGSACSARLAKPSHVLKALGCSDLKASESIRISFGRQTTRQEIDKLLMALKFNKNIKS